MAESTTVIELNEDKLLEFNEFKQEVLSDYRFIRISRECSILAKKEVLTGKAKFGIFGDGKELAQIALAKVFKKGDFRSGYYRDQTLLFATNMITVKQFFAQLYADSNLENEPNSGGRQMNCHFGTRLIDESGNWKSHLTQRNTTSDISCTAAQMPRMVGIGHASKIYRELPELQNGIFSTNGDEICFGMIGDASTAEGHFFESVNAMCTLQIPTILSIWDDGYGISVPSEYQRSKQNLSEILSGFQRTETENGCEIIRVEGWDYPKLISAYKKAEKIARNHHIPVIVHVCELTQPQGHSTSGSHERYKSELRMKFEEEYDCIAKFKEWILDYSFVDEDNTIHKIATEKELEELEEEVKKEVRKEVKEAWNNYQNPILELKKEALSLLESIIAKTSTNTDLIKQEAKSLQAKKVLYKKDVFSSVRKVLRLIRSESFSEKRELERFLNRISAKEKDNYSSHLYSETDNRATNIPQIEPQFGDLDKKVDGRIIVRDNFEKLFEKYPELIAFGEDVGKIGDVNQGMEGLQAKFGELRISDTGIREATIVGQAIGLAVRGLRPIAEIQYLDYIFYGLQMLSDDVATLRYRTRNGQKCPLIIRTRGHRLEGIWHAGSPMGTLIHALRGMYLLVPRDFIRAAGFYNTMLQSDDPCVIIESLNGYRLKEPMPINLGEFTTPVGEVEITKSGTDVTVVTYGSTWKIVNEASKELEKLGINIEIIDAQALIPFDNSHVTKDSIRKTNRLAIVDEDVPGGASAYLLQKIAEEQDAYKYLDSKPITITAKEHRCAYGSDGDYFSKPSIDDVIDGIYNLMHEVNPRKFPL
ncbi:MAG: transketolase [Flavobacteriales bacterium]|nr:transketolase [Flavobacteriales bacterium]